MNRHLTILDDLIELGADMARMLHARVKEHPETVAEATIPFDRIARTARRTILLRRKLSQPARPDHRIEARKCILREVDDAIQLHAEPADMPALQAELRTRLDAPELEDDIDARPVRDIILDICRDLRCFTPYGSNYARRTQADIDALAARAAALPPHWSETPPTPPPPPPKHPPPQPQTSLRDLSSTADAIIATLHRKP